MSEVLEFVGVIFAAITLFIVAVAMMLTALLLFTPLGWAAMLVIWLFWRG